MYRGLHVKYLLFLSYFNWFWTFSTDFRKILKYEISWKSVHWEPDGQTDRERDMTNLIVTLLDFANAPRKWKNQIPCFVPYTVHAFLGVGVNGLLFCNSYNILANTRETGQKKAMDKEGFYTGYCWLTRRWRGASRHKSKWHLYLSRDSPLHWHLPS